MPICSKCKRGCNKKQTNFMNKHKGFCKKCWKNKPKKKNQSANAESDAAIKDASQEKQEAVFSTDKTSDPFSRNR